MTDIETVISDARIRLTQLQQLARSGYRAKAMLGLLALATDLAGYVFEQTGEQLKRSK